MEHALGSDGRDQLTDLLDLAPSYGGAGLQSLEASADEEFLGSFAGIYASLISFCRNTELTVYIKIAEALETLDDLDAGQCCPIVDVVKEANEHIASLKTLLSIVNTEVATKLVGGYIMVEVPGRYSLEVPYSVPELMTLFES